jgi:hypothetical protein
MVLCSAKSKLCLYFLAFLIASLIGRSTASLGDHLPDFKECVKICQAENCRDGDSAIRMSRQSTSVSSVLIVLSQHSICAFSYGPVQQSAITLVNM